MEVLEKKGVNDAYIQIIKDMYVGAFTCVQTQGGLTKYFPISVGLHLGSALSPHLFALVMDVLTRHLQDVPWCMLFADDILLVDKTREGVESKLELWRSTLETKGFRLSRSKTEYMEYNFSSNRPSEGIVTLGDQVVGLRKDSARVVRMQRVRSHYPVGQNGRRPSHPAQAGRWKSRWSYRYD
ncbi:hypothetical protein KFK09_018163 [Dendrobium nobile]|uniref:Reverse transcriptase domain-containing protein n=1 Tax=Dendrobium nobile TaxID=94219 RepID=A0A8T3B0G6_DENNO|nr:hypothetical protein KFK09_018163 [Dendrobium nobile]